MGMAPNVPKIHILTQLNPGPQIAGSVSVFPCGLQQKNVEECPLLCPGCDL